MVITVITHDGVQALTVQEDALMILVDGVVVHTQGDLSKRPDQSKRNVSVGERGVYAGSVQQSTVITGNGNAVAQNGSVASVNISGGVNLQGANIQYGTIAGGNIVQQSTTIDGNGNTVVQGSVVNNGGTVHGAMIGVNHGNIRYGYTFGDDD